MNDTDIKRNGSGYYDETAFKAIKTVQKEQIQPGDIWKNDKGIEYLVIAVNQGVCSCLMLDNATKENSIKIVSKSIKYTIPYFVQYVFANNMNEFVKAIKEDELEAVLKAVADALGIVPADQSEKIKHLQKENDDLKDAYKEAFVNAVEAKKKLAEAEKKINETNDDKMPWQMMYHDLIDRILTKGGLN